MRLTLEMIKFEHSVFALPFALTGALLAWRDAGFPREGLWSKLMWIVIAMVGARSVAMAFNRVLDADVDALNPRTKSRHLPAGLLSRAFTWGFIAFWCLVFAFAAGKLNPLCLMLAPVALGDRDVLFLHQALYLDVSSGAWILARDRSGRRLDRHARQRWIPGSCG